jgi:RimJ/RimL family protein N-acetyltransferase
MELRTDRLILRRWRPGDRAPFTRMNADPEVMRYMIRALSREESDAFVDRIEKHFEDLGFGLWAVEIAGSADLIGFVGLSVPRFEAPFMPAVEIGWRLDRPYWGQGYATEAARASIADGFERVGLREIVSFTVPANVRSVAVMERVGMARDPTGDFDHPNVPEGSPLRRHLLYRIAPKPPGARRPGGAPPP